jgi:hypothetical protein
MEVMKMQYMLLIYDNEKVKLSPTDEATMIQDYTNFTQDIVRKGNFKAADRLQPTSSATTVQVRNGKTITTDGPFAETKEQLGGYYLIEARDLDEALAIAARVPSARSGSIEVRPVFQMAR